MSTVLIILMQDSFADESCILCFQVYENQEPGAFLSAANAAL